MEMGTGFPKIGSDRSHRTETEDLQDIQPASPRLPSHRIGKDIPPVVRVDTRPDHKQPWFQVTPFKGPF